MWGLSSHLLQGAIVSPGMVVSSPVGTQGCWWFVPRALFSGDEVGIPWPAPCCPGCLTAVGCTEGKARGGFILLGQPRRG